MKRKLAILAIVLTLSLASCKCTAERGAMTRLESQQDAIFMKYTVYVGQDPKLDAAAKNDEIKLLQSIRDIVSSLKKSLGE